MLDLLRAIWPESLRNHPAVQDTAVTFWCAPSRESIHVPLKSLDEIDDEDIEALRARGENIYVGSSLRVLGLEADQQGKKSDLAAICAIVTDLDTFDPEHPEAHKAENLPETLEDVESLIEGEADPSAIVDTGNGYQLWHFLKEPICIRSPEDLRRVERAISRYQQRIIARGEERGWHVDATVTAQRVWRVPGFINQKTGKPARLLYCNPNERPTLEEVTGGMTSEETPEIDPGEFLDQIRAALKRTDPKGRHRDAVDKLLAGESFAERGRRDEKLQALCSMIAWHPLGRDADPALLAEVFRPSFTIWAAEPDAQRTVDDEIQKAKDKIERSQADYVEKQKERAQDPRILALAKIIRNATGIDDDESFNAAFVLQHAIINFRANYYVFDWDKGSYSHVLMRNQLPSKLRDAWASAPPGIAATYVDDKGREKLKTVDKILFEYCTVAYPTVGHMDLQESWFDAKSGEFHLAICKRRDIEPVFNPLIDEWIGVFAGEDAEYLRDWIALCPQLDKPNVALYIEGERETGKTLLAQGLSRIWRRGGPSSFERVSGEFNEEILQCPFVQIEEGTSYRKKAEVSVRLRSILGQGSFTVNPKGLTPYAINGFVRAMVSANNPNVLDFSSESLTMTDLEALIQRIRHLIARPESAAFLKAHPEHRDWVTKDQLAAHALYLAEHRTVERHGRFWQPGNETYLHRGWIMGGDVEGLIYEWLLRAASNPKLVYEHFRTMGQRPEFIIGTHGRSGVTGIFVTSQVIIDLWTTYLTGNRKQIMLAQVGEVLAKIRTEQKRIGPKNGKRVDYSVVPVDLILEWGERNGAGDADMIKKLARLPFRSRDGASKFLSEAETIRAERDKEWRVYRGGGDDKKDPGKNGVE